MLLAATVFVLPEDRIAHSGDGLDPRGALPVTDGLVAALYGLNRGVVDGWTSAQTLGLAGVGVVLLAGFVLSEWRTHNPLVPRGLPYAPVARNPWPMPLLGSIPPHRQWTATVT